jgi:hypothetical protein
MNEIRKSPIRSIGYRFVDPGFLPAGRDEYHIRYRQNPRTGYRRLNAHEIEALVRNNNTSDDWDRVLVSDAFDPGLVRNCKFFGLVRIGRLEPWYREFHNLRMPVGLYDSTVISCDFGDNIVVDNVNYLSHFIIGDDAMIVNVNELSTTSTAKFGNGILKEGEPESLRIWLEVCNENGGRSILPFDGMLPGDAYLWARHRDDEALMERLREFTQDRFDLRRGYYGEVGARTVIKNCKIIKDVRIGSDAYLKGANKIKNVTVNSSPEAKSQVGEGCELVNGVIGLGCRVFYGVKAVRFVMASHSQLKYGARLINSYLGNNATISCCEVLNSLIFPFHEQHHNNSFLCAALVMGQSNMAAGATIGSNHNSRANDGELIAGRGFWPGLCVSLKHNSRFASFNIVAKGNYDHELDIPLPFSLVSQDLRRDQLQVMPAYWFLYNLYGLCRNQWKYSRRDLRTEKEQHLENSFLAPDSVNEMMDALPLIERAVGRAQLLKSSDKKAKDPEACRETGRLMLENDDTSVDALEVVVEGFENGRRRTVLLKVRKAWKAYRTMVRLYALENIFRTLLSQKPKGFKATSAGIPFTKGREAWLNVGGQLIPEKEFARLRQRIGAGRIRDWQGVHAFYLQQAVAYPAQRVRHAMACLSELDGVSRRRMDSATLKSWAAQMKESHEWIREGILQSRSKDYANPFRKMAYVSKEEMEKVMGSLRDNAFVSDFLSEMETLDRGVAAAIGGWVRK